MSRPYKYVEEYDSLIHIVADPDTGEPYMVKIGVSEDEVADIKRASDLVFPEHLQGIIHIPKFISDDKGALPKKLRKYDGSIIIMEIAGGEMLRLYRYGISGKSPENVRISQSDWGLFKEAVAFMNANGVVHKDIENTENIFISEGEDGRVRFELIDWGGALRNVPASDLEGVENLGQSLVDAGMVSSGYQVSWVEPDEQALPEMLPA